MVIRFKLLNLFNIVIVLAVRLLGEKAKPSPREASERSLDSSYESELREASCIELGLSKLSQEVLHIIGFIVADGVLESRFFGRVWVRVLGLPSGPLIPSGGLVSGLRLWFRTVLCLI